MKVRRIPDNTLTAVCALLQPYCSEPLTAEVVIAALRHYSANGAPANGNVDDGSALKIKDVAARLNCSPRTVFRLISEGRLPRILIRPRTARIPAKALAEFLEREGRFSHDLS